jgi:hypothetical protein
LIRCLTLLGLCSWLAGCAGWTEVESPYTSAIGDVRVTNHGGDVFKLDARGVYRDSIVGYANDGAGRAWTAISVDAVSQVERRDSRRESGGSTIVLGVVLALTASFVVIGVYCAADDYYC